MDRNARRLVDHQQPPVLVQNVIDDRCRLPGRGRALLANTHGRNPYLVTGFQPIIGPYAAAVDADFSTPQQPVDPAPGHAGQLAVQEVVDPLTGAVRIDSDPSYAGDAAAALLRGLSLHDQ